MSIRKFPSLKAAALYVAIFRGAEKFGVKAVINEIRQVGAEYEKLIGRFPTELQADLRAAHESTAQVAEWAIEDLLQMEVEGTLPWNPTKPQ